jgi:hypothetical protein
VYFIDIETMHARQYRLGGVLYADQIETIALWQQEEDVETDPMPRMDKAERVRVASLMVNSDAPVDMKPRRSQGGNDPSALHAPWHGDVEVLVVRKQARFTMYSQCRAREETPGNLRCLQAVGQESQGLKGCIRIERLRDCPA